MTLEPREAPLQSLAAWPAADQRPVEVRAGEHVFHEGAFCDAIFEIVDGIITIYKNALDGGRQLVGIRLAGDLLAISGNDRYDCSAIAARASTVRRVSRAKVEALMQTDARLAERLLGACRAELAHTREQLMIVGARSALGRVAALLLDLSNRTADGAPAVDLPLSRGEMGDYLGLTIETVSRAMSRLKSSRIIALPRSDLALILDRARL
ncbi:MAG: helix-turn-helix domain-containing protein, partial [Pseudomonadota bacterium]